MKVARTAKMMALGLIGLPILATVSAQSPPAWTPPADHSPLRAIWSFDTKG